jgi:exodeoxyribonuclease V alpha subunit
VNDGHLLVGEQTGAAGAYVGMTRGRSSNVAHLVAESNEDARRQWGDVFGRDRADLGLAHAAKLAAEDVDRYGTIARNEMVVIQAAALMMFGERQSSRPPMPQTSAP